MSKACLVMDMPESCADCQLAEKQSGGYWYCNALHNYTSFIAFKEKSHQIVLCARCRRKNRMLVHMDLLAAGMHA